MPAPTDITVTVTVDSNGTVSTSCLPDVAVIPRNNGVTNIFWSMAAGQPSDKYKVSGLTGLNTTVFTAQGRRGTTGWRATDANNDTSPTDYPYEVEVTEISTGNTHLHDPTIRNGGAGV